MKTKNKWLFVCAISAAIGGMTGSASGSNNWLVVAIVSALTAIFIVWIISSFLK